MSSRRYIIYGIGVVTVLSLGSAAWATLDNLKAYKQAYPDKAAKATCKTCHTDAVGKKGNLNAYGQTLQTSKSAGKALKLTADDIKAAEKTGNVTEKGR